MSNSPTGNQTSPVRLRCTNHAGYVMGAYHIAHGEMIETDYSFATHLKRLGSFEVVKEIKEPAENKMIGKAPITK